DQRSGDLVGQHWRLAPRASELDHDPLADRAGESRRKLSVPRGRAGAKVCRCESQARPSVRALVTPSEAAPLLRVGPTTALPHGRPWERSGFPPLYSPGVPTPGHGPAVGRFSPRATPASSPSPPAANIDSGRVPFCLPAGCFSDSGGLVWCGAAFAWFRAA